MTLVYVQSANHGLLWQEVIKILSEASWSNLPPVPSLLFTPQATCALL